MLHSLVRVTRRDKKGQLSINQNISILIEQLMREMMVNNIVNITLIDNNLQRVYHQRITIQYYSSNFPSLK